MSFIVTLVLVVGELLGSIAAKATALFWSREWEQNKKVKQGVVAANRRRVVK